MGDAGGARGIVARFAELSSARGTLKIRPVDAEAISDHELRDLLRGALDPQLD